MDTAVLLIRGDTKWTGFGTMVTILTALDILMMLHMISQTGDMCI